VLTTKELPNNTQKHKITNPVSMTDKLTLVKKNTKTYKQKLNLNQHAPVRTAHMSVHTTG